MTPLRRVEQVRVLDHTIDQLRAAILRGDYAPEDRLPTEQELTRILSVGRSSIREAIRVLESEGLVEVHRGSGAFVTRQKEWGSTRGEMMRWLAGRKETATQILQVREHIEGLTAYLAAQSMSPAEVEALRAILEATFAALADPSAEVRLLGQLDVRFHLQISSTCGNDIANEIVTHVVPAFMEANQAILWVGRGARRMANEHQAILRAIESQDPEEAERTMRRHVAHVRDDLYHYVGDAPEREPDISTNSAHTPTRVE